MTKFKFKPLDRIKVKAFNAEGRIERCIWDTGPLHIYSVVWLIDSEIKRHEFYEDELEKIT